MRARGSLKGQPGGSPGVKHPRVWAIVLIVASVPALTIGYWLGFLCYIPATNGCFATFDATLGIASLIVAGLLLLGAAMLLTTGRASRRRASDPR